MEKKKKLKELFNKQFDDSQERSYHDDLKLEADTQSQVRFFFIVSFIYSLLFEIFQKQFFFHINFKSKYIFIH